VGGLCANDLVGARTALKRFYRWWDGVGVAELSQLTRTMRAWEAEIFAFHSSMGCSNGPTEAINLLVKAAWNGGSVRESRGSLIAHAGGPLPEGAGRHGKDRTPRTDPPRVGRAPQHHLGSHAGT
jgi:hypothetical protein